MARYGSITIRTTDRMTTDMIRDLAIAARSLRLARATLARKDSPHNRLAVDMNLAWIDQVLDEYLDSRAV